MLIPFNVEPTIGALLIGLLFSCFLFGILTLQAYLYYASFPNDRSVVKAMVIFLWFCELAHCICVCHAVYRLAIVGYGNPSFLIRTPDSLSAAILFSGIIGPLVQIFFAERVRIVSGGKLLIPVFCWALSTLRFALYIVATVAGIDMTTIVQYQAQWEWVLTAVLSIGVANDAVITVSLCYYLTQHKADSIKSTAKMIDRIVVWTAQTGILTSVASLVMLIFFLAMPHNYAWLAIFTFLARLYSNSLLASLNARLALRQSEVIDATIAHNHNSGINSPSQGSQSQKVAINMSTVREISNEDLKVGGSYEGR